jgi:hypothetical protein
MLSSGVTSLSKILSFAFDFDEDFEVLECLLSLFLDLALLATLWPAHVPVLERGSGYSSGFLSLVDALEGGSEYSSGSLSLVDALEGGNEYSSGSLRTVDALEGRARLLEATEGGGWLETRWVTSSVARITVLALWPLLASE